MVADRIKHLREQKGLTQTDLAKQLGITRSSVNAWEMGLSTPTTQCIVALAKLFHVSTDYLLGTDTGLSISLADYSEEEINLIYSLLHYFDSQR